MRPGRTYAPPSDRTVAPAGASDSISLMTPSEIPIAAARLEPSLTSTTRRSSSQVVSEAVVGAIDGRGDEGDAVGLVGAAQGSLQVVERADLDGVDAERPSHGREVGVREGGAA